MPTRPVPVRPGSVPAVLVVFAAAGLAMGQALARVPALRDAIGADKAQLGIALMGMGLGSLLAMPFTGRLVDRFGSRRVVSACVVLACTGYAALSLVPSVPLLLLTLTLTGTAVGVWDVGMNIQATHVERQRGRSWMPYFHAAFSAGAVVGAGIGALAAWRGVGLMQLPVVAAAAAVVALLGAARFVPEEHVEERGDEETGPVARRGLTGVEVLIGLVCLSAALGEGAANDWLALVLVDVHAAPEAWGALVLTAFNVTMTVGRVVGGPVIDRFGRAVLVRGGGLLSAAGIILVASAPSLVLALVGALLWGLGISTIFPAAMSAAGEVPGRGNRAITTVSTVAYGAFLFGGPSIGVLAEVVGLDRALLLVVGFLLLMSALAPVMRERSRRRQREASIQ
ncbi:MFS transporter [Ornithinimicrobium humiphilum]|uniref:Putative MFS family arabinose efflux permease n=1 Tax=Ornithinimicrobium humiphilum TaxID=125288 RepID=A0A543KRK4_9MICO|nr:MFS transporter [Ornithinimicrobium humiphilum]TQM97706.1 putative MFS family arabinose efflux permease [Ornithinimicrobium humiphilum]